MITQKTATQKVQQLRAGLTDLEVAEKIGMSKNTMYKRLGNGEWKKTELALIQTL